MQQDENLTETNAASKISGYFRVKRYVDFVVVFGIAIILVPIILFFMVWVRLTSRGPILYTQTRCGRNGRLFKMHKIRSMIVDAEKNGATWSQEGDTRITPVGKIMRKLHIDELVQIYNVLRGEMALVGPRPERPEFVETLKKEIPGYGFRLQVQPGMSGFAQLNYSADTSIDDVRKKLVLDLEYMEKASFLLDMRILAATWCQFLCTKFSRKVPLKLFGVYRAASSSHENSDQNQNEHKQPKGGANFETENTPEEKTGQ